MASTPSVTPITMGNKSIIFLSHQPQKARETMINRGAIILLPLDKLKICAFKRNLPVELKSRRALAIGTDLRAYFLKQVIIVSNDPNEILNRKREYEMCKVKNDLQAHG